MAEQSGERIADSYQINVLKLVNYKGKDVDIRALMVQMDFCEDIQSPFIQGTIQLEDANDLPQNFPLIGEEKLLVEFRTSDELELFEREFYVYSMTDRIQLNPFLSTYTLHFCSVEMMRSLTQIVSKSYSNKSIDYIVRDLLKALQINEPNIKVDPRPVNYIVPNMTPSGAIGTMLKWANASNEVPENELTQDFVFYENRKGFYFFPREDLKEELGNSTFKFINKHVYNTAQTFDDSLYTINKYEFVKNFDTMESIIRGGLGSKTNSLDLITKKRKEIEYTHEFGIGGLYTTQFPFQDTITQSVEMFVESDSDREESEYFTEHSSTDENIKKNSEFNTRSRVANIYNKIDALRFLVEVPGNTNLLCGQTITVDLPSGFSPDQMDGATLDSFLTGEFQCVALRHIITREKYVTTMELTRSSYEQDHEALSDSKYDGILGR